MPTVRTLGRYTLLEPPIASGGMASVHLARMSGTAGFSRTVAIKRLHPPYAMDPDFVSMFIDEARLASRIRHPNVLPTIDVLAVDGELFLVMEYVHGEALSWLLRIAVKEGKSPPLRIVAAILCNALDGLHAAHEAKSERGELLGLVHRDVSPQNILVGADGVARIIDLGVAKAASRMATTREGQLKGKLGYMAPEHVRGQVTRASDIYSAGIVLWEALAVRRAFQADNEGELLEMVLTVNPGPPSQHAPGVPPELDAVVAKALARNPAGRYATANAMARALEAALPLASSADVGAWVRERTKERLDERTAWVSALEAEPTPPLSSAGGSASTPGAGVAAVVPAATRVERPRTLASRVAPVLVVGAMGVAGIVIASARGREVQATVTAPSSASVGSAAAPVVAEEPEPSSLASASVAVPTAPPAVPPPMHGQPAAVTPVPRRARADCDPPYVFDDLGIKHYKRECGGH